MAETILLDGTPFHIQEYNFPLLIHGTEGSGASFFTMALLADLYRKGKGIIMVSGYSHARDTFFTMTRSRPQTVLIEDDNALNKAEHKRVIFLKREKVHYLPLLLHQLHDSKERIILIKNVEMFPESVFIPLHQHTRIILSGNIDESPLKFKILGRHFATKVYFSPLQAADITLPLLPEFSGYMVGKERTGILAVKKSALTES